jgi:glycosyltransferase involved in cell wall biosynthesis
MRVLYLYSGKRKKRGEIGIDYPDTQFYGLNHLAKYGIEAEYKEFRDLPFFGHFERFLGFRLRHCLMFFLTKKYDIVFGSSLIYQMPLKIIFRPRTKFILLNIYLNRLLTTHRRNFLKYYLIKFLIKRLDGIVCLSNLQKNYLIENYGFPERKVVYIPLGVDIEFHQYVPDEKRDDFILSAGSDEGRDYKTVLEVARLCPNLKFILVCGYKNTKHINKKEIPDNVEILYYIPPKELREFYRRAKIFLLATYPDTDIRGADCSGQTVLLDAMASGLPVIATPKLYLSDYAKNNQEIIITNSNSPQEIKEQIELLFKNSALRKQLAQNARKKVENNFTSQLMAQKLADYFKSLCD